MASTTTSVKELRQWLSNFGDENRQHYQVNQVAERGKTNSIDWKIKKFEKGSSQQPSPPAATEEEQETIAQEISPPTVISRQKDQDLLSLPRKVGDTIQKPSPPCATCSYAVSLAYREEKEETIAQEMMLLSIVSREKGHDIPSYPPSPSKVMMIQSETSQQPTPPDAAYSVALPICQEEEPTTPEATVIPPFICQKEPDVPSSPPKVVRGGTPSPAHEKKEPLLDLFLSKHEDPSLLDQDDEQEVKTTIESSSYNDESDDDSGPLSDPGCSKKSAWTRRRRRLIMVPLLLKRGKKKKSINSSPGRKLALLLLRPGKQQLTNTVPSPTAVEPTSGNKEICSPKTDKTLKLDDCARASNSSGSMCNATILPSNTLTSATLELLCNEDTRQATATGLQEEDTTVSTNYSQATNSSSTHDSDKLLPSSVAPNAVDGCLVTVFGQETRRLNEHDQVNYDYKLEPLKEETADASTITWTSSKDEDAISSASSSSLQPVRVHEVADQFGGGAQSINNKKKQVDLRKQELERLWAADKLPSHVRKVKWQPSGGTYKKKVVLDFSE
jgi:hypothetical protein